MLLLTNFIFIIIFLLLYLSFPMIIINIYKMDKISCTIIFMVSINLRVFKQLTFFLLKKYTMVSLAIQRNQFELKCHFSQNHSPYNNKVLNIKKNLT